MNDTPIEVIKTLQPIKIKGLYAYDDEGNKMTPSHVYFGIEIPDYNGVKGHPNGLAYYHYNNSLTPVYKSDGKRLRMENLANVCCYYRNGILTDWHRD